MAKELFSRFAKGPPAGSATGISLLIGAGLAVVGIKESIYTVDGGHRAIIFSRIGGIQQEVYAEGLHFKYINYCFSEFPLPVTRCSALYFTYLIDVSNF